MHLRYLLVWVYMIAWSVLLAQPSKHTITMASSDNVGALNPQGYSKNAMFAQNMVYEGLVKLDKKGDIIPSLATSWIVSDDGTTYTFFLRKNVRFSNGEVFNADAVVLNFTSLLKNRERHSWAGLMQALKQVQKLDSHTIRLTLKHPYTPTLNELAAVRPFRFLAPSAFPSDLDLIKHNPKPIGTGAYMLTESKLGISDTFTKNPYYWDADRYGGIYFDEVAIKVIFDPNAKLAALKTGQVDILYGQDMIPIEIFQSITKNKRFSTYLSPPIFTTFLVLNPASSKLAKTSVRQGISMGINKDDLVYGVYANLAKKADRFYGLESLAALKLPSFPIYDKILAQQALEQKPTNDISTRSEPIVLELLFVSDNPAQKMLAEIIQAQLKEIGITIRLVGAEPTIYRNRQASGAFELALTDSWGAPYEPLSHLYSMKTRGHIDYVVLNALAQKQTLYHLIDTAIGTTDSKALQNALKNILTILTESNAYLPLAYQRNKAIMRKGIKGVNMGVLVAEIPFWEWYEESQ